MYGKLIVKLVSEESEGEVVTRKIEVIEDTHYHVPVRTPDSMYIHKSGQFTHLSMLTQGAPNHAVLTQYHHTGWSSQKAPETSSILKIMDALIKTQRMTGNGAIAVVCKYVRCTHPTLYLHMIVHVLPYIPTMAYTKMHTHTQ